MSKEAMKLALEALEWCHGGEPCGTAQAITALREALAEQPAQQQEPIAFIDMSQWPPIRWRDGMIRKDVAQFDGQGLVLSTSLPAQPAQPQQEPVAKDNSSYRLDPPNLDGFYASPPTLSLAQRTWVGLTDEEMFEAIRQLYSSDKVARLAVSHSKDEYRAIEAKLKEKNT